MGMTVSLLGVGEAFDADQTNASVLVRADGFTLLIDCGHSAVAPLWRACPDPEAVDAIYLTHLHCDHVLGLPPVLDRWAYDGRRRPLTIVTAQAGIGRVRELCAAVRIPLDAKSRFPISLQAPDGRIGPFAMATALTGHAAPNEAIRLEAGGRRFAYSGDGRPTDASRACTCCCTSAGRRRPPTTQRTAICRRYAIWPGQDGSVFIMCGRGRAPR